jgi:hypothetical protein
LEIIDLLIIKLPLSQKHFVTRKESIYSDSVGRMTAIRICLDILAKRLYGSQINSLVAMPMNILQLISIFLEIVVATLGVLLAVSKKKMYGWFIALTFVIYVFYDLANLFTLNVSQDLLYTFFLLATLSILWATWRIFLEA